MDIEKLRFPIGRFNWTPEQNNEQLLVSRIDSIAAFPAEMSAAVDSLTDAQLDTVYRPDGWTLRQVVHHCADSHMNSYIRFKLALTEDVPTIKPYDEAQWGLLPDAVSLPLAPSLKILEGLHLRWTVLLRSLNTADRMKKFLHPEQGRAITLEEYIAFYAWHGRHHLVHITNCRERNGW